MPIPPANFGILVLVAFGLSISSASAQVLICTDGDTYEKHFVVDLTKRVWASDKEAGVVHSNSFNDTFKWSIWSGKGDVVLRTRNRQNTKAHFHISGDSYRKGSCETISPR